MKKALIFGSGLFAINWTMHEYKYDNYIVSRSLNKLIKCKRYIILDCFSMEKVREIIKDIRPNIVINAVAITDVDFCEENPRLAYDINALFPMYVAKVCTEVGVPMVQISTDHFDSEAEKKRDEGVRPIPINAYGYSKIEGERLVRENLIQNLIVRTNFFGWGDSSHKSSSQKMLDSLNSGKIYNGFKDILFNPIALETLVKTIGQLINQKYFGTINIAANQSINKYEFAKLISKEFKINPELIIESSYKINRGVNRPKIMTLDNSLVKNLFPEIDFDLYSNIKIFIEVLLKLRF